MRQALRTGTLKRHTRVIKAKRGKGQKGQNTKNTHPCKSFARVKKKKEKGKRKKGERKK